LRQETNAERKTMFKRYWKNKQGQGMSEYLILVLLIAVGSIAVTTTMGSHVHDKIKQIGQKIYDTNFTDVEKKS
jgi:Flp pilus assembly pilin Flp